MALEQLTSLFAWSSLINTVLLALSFICVVFFGRPVSKMHACMFGVDEPTACRCYMQLISLYKLLIIVFNVVPYVVLRCLI